MVRWLFNISRQRCFYFATSPEIFQIEPTVVIIELREKRHLSCSRIHRCSNKLRFTVMFGFPDVTIRNLPNKFNSFRFRQIANFCRNILFLCITSIATAVLNSLPICFLTKRSTTAKCIPAQMNAIFFIYNCSNENA